jgi:predicted nucleotidyltransferase
MTHSQPENFFQFEKLLVEIARAGVDFAVVGGVAVSLNGFIRATDDVDILINEEKPNVEKLLKCLVNWGEGWARELTFDDFVPQEGSIRVMEEFDLDIFTRMRGHSLADFRPRLRQLEIEGARIPYLAPEDLILLKSPSWREKDQIDVAALKKLVSGY